MTEPAAPQTDAGTPAAGINPELLERLVEMKRAEDELDAQLKALRAESAKLTDVLTEQFVNANTQSVKTRTGATVYLRTQQFWSVKQTPDETKEEAEARAERLLAAVGLDEMVQTKTILKLKDLAAYVAEQKEIGGEVDERIANLITSFDKHSLNVRRR